MIESHINSPISLIIGMVLFHNQATSLVMKEANQVNQKERSDEAT